MSSASAASSTGPGKTPWSRASILGTFTIGAGRRWAGAMRCGWGRWRTRGRRFGRRTDGKLTSRQVSTSDQEATNQSVIRWGCDPRFAQVITARLIWLYEAVAQAIASWEGILRALAQGIAQGITEGFTTPRVANADRVGSRPSAHLLSSTTVLRVLFPVTCQQPCTPGGPRKERTCAGL